ncbi:VanZ family protein [Corynebacterium epidermidicanis]|uniref:VanZ like family protein n=1 Tax=Corynebacterium epidermidicanis TaxID=1050174 RepID=A0A0G3GZP5_9CORY|nr:VanZ family protein [Corynebacterium epidermidicanis]AKK04307.1 VanZ like family protein [Corynebacterium epidermidicanis]
MKHRNVVAFVLGVYSCLLAAVTLGKSHLVIAGLWNPQAHHVRRLELIPFGDFFTTTPWWGSVTNAIANVGLFIPMGMLLAMWWPGRAFRRRVVLTCLNISLLIEVLQYFFALGFTDVDDVILNTFGAWIGCAALDRWQLSKRWVVLATFLISMLLLSLLGFGSREMILAKTS